MPKFYIETETDRDKYIAFLKGLDVTKKWSSETKKYVPRRSSDQNNLYHWWAGIIAKELGWEKYEMEDYLKENYLPASGIHTRTGLNGEIFETRTTTTLTKPHFSEFLNSISRLAAENGIVLPHPEDQQFRG